MDQKLYITALVLAGGKSTRMGQDKARIRLSGKALLERVVETVTSLCREVVFVTAKGQSLDWLPSRYPFRSVRDLYPEGGPLGGLYTGLKAAAHPYSMLVGCDMPFLNPHLLAFLVEQSKGYDAVVPLAKGRPQPLHAIYSQRCLGKMENLLAKEGAGLRDLLAAVNTRRVPQEEVSRYDFHLTSFFNVNTPSDLKEAERLLESCKDVKRGIEVTEREVRCD